MDRRGESSVVLEDHWSMHRLERKSWKKLYLIRRYLLPYRAENGVAVIEWNQNRTHTYLYKAMVGFLKDGKFCAANNMDPMFSRTFKAAKRDLEALVELHMRKEGAQ